MVWYAHLFQNFPQFIVIHTVKGFGIVNKAEIDVFLETSCFFDDPVDVRMSQNVIPALFRTTVISKTALILICFPFVVTLKVLGFCTWFDISRGGQRHFLVEHPL